MSLRTIHFRYLIALLIVLVLPGCANFLDVKVTRYHSLPAPPITPNVPIPGVKDTKPV
jgi:hypothetical protein